MVPHPNPTRFNAGRLAKVANRLARQAKMGPIAPDRLAKVENRLARQAKMDSIAIDRPQRSRPPSLANPSGFQRLVGWEP